MHSVTRRLLLSLCVLLPVPALAQTPPPAPPASSPLTIHLGDADFLIGGFLDAAAITRSTNVGSGMSTTFGTIPFDNTPQGNLHETRFTSQNSRLSLLITTPVGGAADESLRRNRFPRRGAGEQLGHHQRQYAAHAAVLGAVHRKGSSSSSAASRGAC